MTCNCGKGQAHSTIATTEAVMLAERLRRVFGDNFAVEPQTVVCVEDDSWLPHNPKARKREVSKIVVTFHDVSDVQWVTDQLARQPRP